MKKLFSAILGVLLFSYVASAAIGSRVRSTAEFDEYTVTFGQSVVDTIKWTRPAGVSGISFGVYVADTADFSTTSAVYRVVKGVVVAAVTADTLANLEAQVVADYLVPESTLDAVTLAPLADEYWFVWTMHSTACGTGTANTMTVRIYKQHAK